MKHIAFLIPGWVLDCIAGFFYALLITLVFSYWSVASIDFRYLTL